MSQVLTAQRGGVCLDKLQLCFPGLSVLCAAHRLEPGHEVLDVGGLLALAAVDVGDCLGDNRRADVLPVVAERLYQVVGDPLREVAAAQVALEVSRVGEAEG
jgi:hypothetical protein